MGMLGSGGGGGRGAGVPVVVNGESGGGRDGLEGMSEKARGKMRVIDAYEADSESRFVPFLGCFVLRNSSFERVRPSFLPLPYLSSPSSSLPLSLKHPH